MGLRTFLVIEKKFYNWIEMKLQNVTNEQKKKIIELDMYNG